MNVKKFAAVLLAAALLFLTACGARDEEPETAPVVTVTAPEPSAPVTEDSPEPPGKPFSERAEGVYYMTPEGADSEFPVQLRLFNVYGNLYGSIYSPDMGFAALEIFPREEGTMQDTELAACPVQVMSFSIQSDFGQYWPGPAGYTLRIIGNTVAFSDYDGAGESLIPPDAHFVGGELYSGPQLDFDPFPYTAEFVEWLAEGNLPKLEPEGFKGLWQREDDELTFLEIGDGGTLQLYRKEQGHEVTLCRGGYVSKMTDNDGVFAVTYCLSRLGNGSMPMDGTLSCTMSGDKLIFLADDNLFEGAGAVTLRRVSPMDVPEAAPPAENASGRAEK